MIPYKMNIWRQFNLANESFLSDWWILYWQTLLYLIHWVIKKRTWQNLIWRIFVIRQTTKINSTLNFHLIQYILMG